MSPAGGRGPGGPGLRRAPSLRAEPPCAAPRDGTPSYTSLPGSGTLGKLLNLSDASFSENGDGDTPPQGS